MAQSDAELYLRLAGERALLDPEPDDGRPDNSLLGSAAHALVAVGALMPGVAQPIVDDYDLALAYRGGESPHHRHVRARRAARRAAPAPALGPLRAVPCHRLIEQPWGELSLSYVVLGDDVTTLHVSMRPAPPPPRPSQPRRHARRQAVLRAGAGGGPGLGGGTLGPGLPAHLTLTDDCGTTATADFSGGGDSAEWRGEFEARPALALGTAWIDVLGERVELPSESASATRVWTEPRTDANPACSYLWARLASVAEFHSPDAVEKSIEALVAAGALAADDAGIVGVRAVADGLFHGAGTTHGFPGPLPEPWRSVMARRGQAGGPEGLVVTGVTTPPFDGFTLALLAVRSADEGFTADVRTTPGVPHWHAFPGPLDQPMLNWWAADDRGHHYLGHMDSWSSGPDDSGGQIGFWPALDPAARVLDIMPTTMAARAVIRVPLDWSEEW